MIASIWPTSKAKVLTKENSAKYVEFLYIIGGTRITRTIVICALFVFRTYEDENETCQYQLVCKHMALLLVETARKRARQATVFAENNVCTLNTHQERWMHQT